LARARLTVFWGQAPVFTSAFPDADGIRLAEFQCLLDLLVVDGPQRLQDLSDRLTVVHETSRLSVVIAKA
jgi:hypothetical protein